MSVGGPWQRGAERGPRQRRASEGRREGGRLPAPLPDPSSDAGAPGGRSALAALPRRPSGGSRLLNRTDMLERSLLLPLLLRGRDRELHKGEGGGEKQGRHKRQAGNWRGACRGSRHKGRPREGGGTWRGAALAGATCVGKPPAGEAHNPVPPVSCTEQPSPVRCRASPESKGQHPALALVGVQAALAEAAAMHPAGRVVAGAGRRRTLGSAGSAPPAAVRARGACPCLARLNSVEQPLAGAVALAPGSSPSHAAALQPASGAGSPPWPFPWTPSPPHLSSQRSANLRARM